MAAVGNAAYGIPVSVSPVFVLSLVECLILNNNFRVNGVIENLGLHLN